MGTMKRKSDSDLDAPESDSCHCRRFSKAQRSECYNQDVDITRDRISQLPNHLLSLILSNLSLRDVQRAHLLSYRWKHLWSPMSMLTLDWPNMCLSDENHHIWAQCINPCVEYKHKFVQGVNHIIERCSPDGKIFSFKISFCLGLDDTNDIDRWLRFALQKGTQQLYLWLFCANFRFKSFDWEGEIMKDKYVFRCQPFYGLENNLKRLNLRGCMLDLNLASHFHNLNSLSLEKMWLRSYDLGRLFVGLINLKVLAMRLCHVQKKLCLGSLTLLQSFSLIQSPGIREIELSNLNLVTFFCKSLEQVKCNFDGAPNLNFVCCHPDEVGLQHIITHFPFVLPKLDALFIYSGVDWVNSFPKSIATFKNVHTLKMKFWKNNKFDVSKLMYIISFFPQLNLLHVETQCSEDSGEDITSLYVNSLLKEVYILGFRCTLDHIKFVAYCLKIAPNLEKLEVYKDHLGDYLYREEEPWEEGEKEMFYEILQELLLNNVIDLVLPMKYYIGSRDFLKV